MHLCLTPNAESYLSQFQTILSAMECGMTTPELTDSISHNFIVQMIPHHQAAIEMSQNILKYTTCRPLEKIASGIITEQTESIRQMQAALEACSLCQNSEKALCAYQSRFDGIIGTMLHGMAAAPKSNCLDTAFMREMIPHHLGAIRMSENALRFPICKELSPILEAIISSQTRGVRQMRSLLSCM